MKGHPVILTLTCLAFSSSIFASVETAPSFAYSDPVDLGDCGPSYYKGSVETMEDRRCSYPVVIRVYELTNEVLDAHYELGIPTSPASCHLLPLELKELLPVSKRIRAGLNAKLPQPKAASSHERFDLHDCVKSAR